MLALIISLVLLNALLAQIGQALLKSGMNKIGFIRIRDLKHIKTILLNILRSWQVMVGLVLFVSAIIVYMFVIARDELSFVQPLTSVSYIMILIISRVYFKEAITLNRILGVFVILIGITIVVIEDVVPLHLYLPLKTIPPFQEVLEVLWG